MEQQGLTAASGRLTWVPGGQVSTPRLPLHPRLYPCAPPPGSMSGRPSGCPPESTLIVGVGLWLEGGRAAGGDEPQGSSSVVWNRPIHTMCSELRPPPCPSPPGPAVRRPQAPDAHGKGSWWLQGPFEASVGELVTGGLNYHRRGASSAPGRRAADSSPRAVCGVSSQAPPPVPPHPSH